MRSSKTSDARLINLFLDMLAAEQGAGANTLEAYRRDLADFSEFLGLERQAFCRCRNAGPAGLPRRSRRTRLQVVERGATAVGDAASVSFPAQRADSRRRSGRHPVGAEARPWAAEGVDDRRRRSPADARQSLDRGIGSLGPPAASRAAALLPARSALRHGLKGIGTSGAAALGGTARRPHDRGARQGQQGTAGAAERGVAAGDGRLSRRGGSAQAGDEEVWQARNGCFPRSAKVAT